MQRGGLKGKRRQMMLDTGQGECKGGRKRASVKLGEGESEREGTREQTGSQQLFPKVGKTEGMSERCV